MANCNSHSQVGQSMFDGDSPSTVTRWPTVTPNPSPGLPEIHPRLLPAEVAAHGAARWRFRRFRRPWGRWKWWEWPTPPWKNAGNSWDWPWIEMLTAMIFLHEFEVKMNACASAEAVGWFQPSRSLAECRRRRQLLSSGATKDSAMENPWFSTYKPPFSS